MNTLYIIGNGFDLAHGIKTSYSDFILWYIKDCIHKKYTNHDFDDGLVKIAGRTYSKDIHNFEKITDIQNFINNCGGSITYQKGFISKIIDTELKFNWVDIETEYYKSLIEIVNSPILQSQNIKTLNDQFKLLRDHLEDYLISINREFIIKREIKRHFKNDNYNALNKNMVVNFNYTSTIDSYIQLLSNCKLINIHGRLNDPKNPIIFGYSNTKNAEFEKVHLLEDIEFQKYIKLYNYSENNGYKAITEFIDDASYNVKILGHSCGLSDGDILATLFMHVNCKRIEICFYEKNEEIDDFSEKTRIISKHYPAAKQNELLEKIVTKDKSVPLVPYNNKNVAVF